MRPTFEDALGDLLAEYHDRPIDELISALEIQVSALNDQKNSGMPEVDHNDPYGNA